MAPLLTPEAQQENLEKVASLGQRNRCPGAVERAPPTSLFPNFDCVNTGGPKGPGEPNTRDTPACFTQGPPPVPAGNTRKFQQITAADYTK